MKVVIINRAVPGSGKSTFAKAIKGMSETLGKRCSIHSTDDFHMVDGEYKFNPSKLGYFHSKNLEQFTESCQTGIDIVICDNTNINPVHCLGYVEAGRVNGYKVINLFFVPSSIEDHMGRNVHAVPREAIENMITGLNTNDTSIGEDITYIINPNTFEMQLKQLPSEIVSFIGG